MDEEEVESAGEDDISVPTGRASSDNDNDNDDEEVVGEEPFVGTTIEHFVGNSNTFWCSFCKIEKVQNLEL